MHIPNILSIAGTDPTAGAGIQADSKTISALGAYALTVITAVIAQNTQRVASMVVMDSRCVIEQIDAVFSDVQVDAVKIGLVADAKIADAIAQRLSHFLPRYVVFDPVMRSSSGRGFIDAKAIDVMRERILPLCTVLTPNICEAAQLLGTTEARCVSEMQDQAQRLVALGPEHVLLKGGHIADPVHSTDVLGLRGHPQMYCYQSLRLETKNTHGTGCTLSSAIAALLPRYPVPTCVVLAKAFVYHSLQAASGWRISKGAGPLHHFYRLWDRPEGEMIDISPISMVTLDKS